MTNKNQCPRDCTKRGSEAISKGSFLQRRVGGQTLTEWLFIKLSKTLYRVSAYFPFVVDKLKQYCLTLFTIMIVFVYYLTPSFASNYADTETLDANQHVIMFEKGVDSFMAGDYEKCDDYWLPLARSGDFMAARNMALLYHRGIGVRKDLEEAELFYRLAADNGVTVAQTVFGTLLIKGSEFERNLPDAVRYLTAAYQAGDPVAAWNLGLLYENGVGVDKNLEKALSLFHISARGGHEAAIIRISGQPQEGYAPPQEVSKAVKTALDDDTQFDTRTQPIVPEKKTFAQKVDIDKQHDKEHFSDRINFEKSLQSDEPDFILKKEADEYKKVQVGIDKELDPFGVANSKKNRIDEPLNRNNLGDNPQLTQAEDAYNSQKYAVARKIWEELFQKSSLDEAAYRLGKMYFDGVGVKKDLFRTYYYWKKGADAGGEKTADSLEAFRASISDKELLEYEQKIM